MGIGKNCKKLELEQNIDFADSLHLFRHYMKDEPSYSQPILYKSMFKDKYMAHHALEDAKALHKMITHTADGKDVIDMFNSIPKKKKKNSKYVVKCDSDLIDVKGIGASSVQIFKSKKINTQNDLHEWISTHDSEEFLKSFNKVYAYKKLCDRLYSGEIKLLYNRAVV